MVQDNRVIVKGTVEIEIIGESGDTLETIAFHGEHYEIQKMLADCLTDAVMKSGIVPGDTIKLSLVQY